RALRAPGAAKTGRCRTFISRTRAEGARKNAFTRQEATAPSREGGNWGTGAGSGTTRSGIPWIDGEIDRDRTCNLRYRPGAFARAGKCRQQVTARTQSDLSGTPNPAHGGMGGVQTTSIETDPAALSAAWLAGPPPAALAEIEVSEEIEPPTI